MEYGSKSPDLTFETIFDAAPDAMVIVDQQGVIVNINQQTKTLFGYTSEELIGQKIEILVPSRFVPNHKSHRDAYHARPTFRSMGANQDLFAARKDGTEFPVEISLSPIEYQGETWVCSAIRDVTDKRHQIAQQQAKERQLQNIFENFPGTVFRCLCENDWPIVMISKEVGELTGYVAEEFLGDNALRFGKIIHPEDHKNVEDVVLNSIELKQPYVVDYRIVRKDGDIRWVKERGEVVYGESGNVEFLDGVIFDITESLETAEQLAASEEQFFSIVQNVPGAVYRCRADQETEMLFISNQFEKITGYPISNFKGHSKQAFIRLIHPEDLEPSQSAVEYALKNKLPFNIEYRLSKQNGDIAWVNERGKGIYDDNDNLEFQDGTFFDITESKKIEAELAHQRLVLDEAQHLGKIGSWEYDIERDKLNWSDQVYHLHNFDRHEPNEDLAQASLECYADEDRERLRDAFQACVDTGVPYDLELRFKPKDKEWLWVRTVGRPFKDELTGRKSIIGNILDITEYKEASEALMKAKNEAESANRAKSSFLANMSHELRTPMNAVIGYSEMLIEDAEDDGLDEIVADLDRIRKAGKHLLELINDVLDLSKVEAGKMDVVFDLIRIPELISDVEQTVAGLIGQNGNSFEVMVDPALKTFISDYVKLKQSLLNILSNAAKFTKAGTIYLKAFAEGEHIIFEVRDTGIGIAENKIATLFDEFTQADETTTREFGGTGLGLAITKRFCEMMDGEISVDSELGVGSVFTIKLPAAPVIHEDIGTNESAGIAEKLEQRPVLIIEDDPNAANLLERTLKKEGYSVAKASNGVEGLEMARSVDPFVITLDVMMPEKDGWTVLRELKEDNALKSIPVIMISVLGNLDLGYALGANSYLTKPIRKDILLEQIEKCIPEDNTDRGPILIVDDEPDAQELLHKILVKRGWHTQIASNGKEALQAIEQEIPSLVLLDLMMPVMDGFEFMKELRRIDAYKQIPVIVITARNLSFREIEELNENVEQIVYKGAYNVDELMSEVKQLVNNIKRR